MPIFEFSLVVNGIESVKKMEIPERELKEPYSMHNEAASDYRKNVINKHLEKWALSRLTLSYEEVEEHATRPVNQS